MDEMDDLPLDPSPAPVPPDDEPRPFWPWIVGFVIVAAAVAAVVYWQWKPTPEPGPGTSVQTPGPAAGRAALGPDVGNVAVPALDESDTFVRDLVRQLSSRPEVLAWLATDGLIRNVAVCIDNVADGQSPAVHLKPVAPAQKFLALGSAERFVADPRSFQRYDGLAGAVSSLDAAGVARLYATLKPRLDEAYQQLGHPAGGIDDGTERALVHLLETPDVPATAPLTLAVYSYRYVDDRFEELSGAQKQLLRMGPGNVATVRAKLAELARALGIPDTRLPAGVR